MFSRQQQQWRPPQNSWTILTSVASAFLSSFMLSYVEYSHSSHCAVSIKKGQVCLNMVSHGWTQTNSIYTGSGTQWRKRHSNLPLNLWTRRAEFNPFFPTGRWERAYKPLLSAKHALRAFSPLYYSTSLGYNKWWFTFISLYVTQPFVIFSLYLLTPWMNYWPLEWCIYKRLLFPEF